MTDSVMPADSLYLTPSAKLLIAASSEVLAKWAARVRGEIKEAAEVPQPILIDTLPLFITNLAQALDVAHTRRTATESSSVAREHGGERARLTRFSPNQVLREYFLLRDVITETLSAADCYGAHERAVVQVSVDLAIEEAMMAFHLVQTGLRNQFVATLSHDLRIPLGAARLSAELVMRSLARKSPAVNSDASVDENIEVLKRVLANVDRTDQMIQHLLDTNAVQAGERLHLKIRQGNLLEHTRIAIGELSKVESERFTLEGEAVDVWLDLELMRRAVDNLLGNAIKYGDPTKPIGVKVCGRLGRALISVHNEGAPIPSDEQGQLFTNLIRARSAKESTEKGWGLGLTFVRGVCESHGGSIAVESSFELGTTFTIDVPADARILDNQT